MAHPPKRILLATIGSLGDLHPCLALALGLCERGHHAVIASTELYRAKVEKLGFEFHPIRPNIEARDPELLSKVMDMRRGPEFLLRKLIFPAVRETYQDLLAAATGCDLLVAGEIVFAAPLVAETMRMPWASAILSPFSFYSIYDPPVSPISPSFTFLGGHTRLINRSLFALARLVTRHWSRPVSELRRELGLGPGRNAIFDDKFSPNLNLALFSRAIAQPQPDWPPNTVQPGYLFYDRDDSGSALPPQLDAFLKEGDPLIVFTLGSSAVHDPRGFFETSAQAAALIGRRAVFLIGDNPSPAAMPNDSIAVPYAPFSELFPHAAVVVHQGGSGTTAQALRAGKPALIMPCGFDQPDNAARVKRIGAGLSIPRDKYKPARVAKELERLMDEPAFADNAARVAGKLATEDGVGGACDVIELLLNERSLSPLEH
jgi:rhamnosyltransferase subunit B